MNPKVHFSSGGTKLKEDKYRLGEWGAQILVATPGRTLDLINKNYLQVDQI